MLLWVTSMGLAGGAVALFERSLRRDTHMATLGEQAVISLGFYAFLLFSSNPFERLKPPAPDGQGLNPLLQDPGRADLRLRFGEAQLRLHIVLRLTRRSRLQQVAIGRHHRLGAADDRTQQIRARKGTEIIFVDITRIDCPARRFGRHQCPERQRAISGDESIVDNRALRSGAARSEEHTSELQSLMRTSYTVYCLKKQNIL